MYIERCLVEMDTSVDLSMQAKLLELEMESKPLYSHILLQPSPVIGLLVLSEKSIPFFPRKPRSGHKGSGAACH